MPSEITEGTRAIMTIAAECDDGLDITDSRGRFIEVGWEMPSGSKQQPKTSQFRDGKFQVEFSSFELHIPGEYRFYINRIFGFDVKPGLALPAGSLPTIGQPHKMTVESSSLKRTVGIAVGATVALLVVVTLWCAELGLFHDGIDSLAMGVAGLCESTELKPRNSF